MSGRPRTPLRGMWACVWPSEVPKHGTEGDQIKNGKLAFLGTSGARIERVAGTGIGYEVQQRYAPILFVWPGATGEARLPPISPATGIFLTNFLFKNFVEN